jgi:hypothetical protein
MPGASTVGFAVASEISGFAPAAAGLPDGASLEGFGATDPDPPHAATIAATPSTVTPPRQHMASEARRSGARFRSLPTAIASVLLLAPVGRFTRAWR